MINGLIPFAQLAILLLVGLMFIGICVWAFGQILDVLSQPAIGPKHKLIDQLGRVTAPIYDARGGKVVVAGEVWDALPAEPLGEGCIEENEEIRVKGFDSVNPQVLRVIRQPLASPGTRPVSG